MARSVQQAPPAPAPVAGNEVCAIGDTLIREVQKAKALHLAEAAIDFGILHDTQLPGALARKYEYPFIADPLESGVDPRVFAAYKPFEPRAESLRSLRSQLTMRWFSQRRRALAVISPEGRGHSSYLAANLAIIFAQLGERTLLIDANLRSSLQHTLFGVAASEGLSGVLGGRCSVKEALRPVAPFNCLSLLCAGASVPNPQELLARDSFVSLMELMPSKFRAVIVDTPPAFECADAQIVAARAGACLVAARRHHTKVRDLRRITQMLSPSGAQVLGVAICD